MSVNDYLGLLFLLFIFITAVLYMLLGLITVRKLRNNPKTKEHLGLEFASGWDIINVAKAFSMPQWFHNKLKDSPLSFLRADHELLYKHTTKFDRVLARVFYVCLYITGLGGIALALLDKYGFFG